MGGALKKHIFFYPVPFLLAYYVYSIVLQLSRNDRWERGAFLFNQAFNIYVT